MNQLKNGNLQDRCDELENNWEIQRSAKCENQKIQISLQINIKQRH